MSSVDPSQNAAQAPDEVRRMRVRRAVNIPRFLLSGALIGCVIGLVIDAVGPPVRGYSAGTSMAYLAVLGALVGVMLGGVAAVLVDRRS